MTREVDERGAARKEAAFVEMRVASLTLDPHTNMPVLLLKDREGRASVPLWIGLMEASAIAAEFEKADATRPLTHDLMNEALVALGASVVRVEITDVRENVFFARLVMRRGKRTVEVYARPSDAVALALRAGCPILVERRVIEKCRHVDLRLAGTGDGSLPAEGDEGRHLLEGLSDDAFGKWTM